MFITLNDYNYSVIIGTFSYIGSGIDEHSGFTNKNESVLKSP